MRAETLEDSIDGEAIVLISFGNKGEVIHKEKVENVMNSSTDGNKGPIEGINLIVDSPKNEFHAKDKEVGWHGVSLPNSSCGIKTRDFPSIYENKDGGIEIWDMIKKVSLGGKFK